LVNAKTWTVRAVAVAVLGSGLYACGSAGMPNLPPSSDYTISGRVEGSDGSPLAYASLALAGSPLGTLADGQGNFGFNGVRSGTYGLTVIYLGFRSNAVRFTVPGASDSTATVNTARDAELGPALVDSLGPVTVSYQVRGAGQP
jgi:hypothetical protein